MPTYLFQGCYTSESIAAMMQKPEDRSAVVRKLIEGFGGKLEGFWLSLGEFGSTKRGRTSLCLTRPVPRGMIEACREAPDNVPADMFTMSGIAPRGDCGFSRNLPIIWPSNASSPKRIVDTRCDCWTGV
jgi:hypothetical protein